MRKGGEVWCFTFFAWIFCTKCDSMTEFPVWVQCTSSRWKTSLRSELWKVLGQRVTVNCDEWLVFSSLHASRAVTMVDGLPSATSGW